MSSMSSGRPRKQRVRKELLGTRQHPEARDLSRWLVHLTRSEGELLSILRSGCIEAPNPFGVGKDFHIVVDDHRSVCLTEIPLSELERMTKTRPWGIVFDKERLRKKYGAQPVWYLSEGSPELNAIHTAMWTAEQDPDAPIWTLTPFIENVRSIASQHPNDWRWEREWRVRGDFEFCADDVKTLVLDIGSAPTFFETIDLELPYTIPGSIPVTWPTESPSGGNYIDRLLGRFTNQYSAPDEAGAFWDKEDGVFLYLNGEMVDLDEALDDVFGEMTSGIRDELYDELSSRSDLWCRADASWVDEPCGDDPSSAR